MTDRTREMIEKDIKSARAEIECAENDLENAKDRLDELEAELEALPPDHADLELWFARRDLRQLSMKEI